MFGSMIDGQEQRNETLRAEIKQLDKQIEEINNLESAKQKFIARMEIIEKLQRSRPEIVHLFDEIVRTVPEGVYLTGVKQTDKRLKFEGIAQSSTRVSTFMRNIDGSEWLQNPELEVVETKTRPGRRLELHAVRRPGEHRRATKTKRPRSRSTRVASSRRHAMNLIEELRTLDPQRSRPLAAADPHRRRGRVVRRADARAVLLLRLARASSPELDQRAGRRSSSCAASSSNKHAKAVNLEVYKQQLKDIERSFGALLRQLPGKTEVPNLLVDISQTGLGRGPRREAVPARARAEARLLRGAAHQDPPVRQLSRVR